MLSFLALRARESEVMPTPNSAPRTGRDWRSLQSALARIMVAADDFADEVANSKGPLWLEFELRLAFRRIEGQSLQLLYKGPKDASANSCGIHC